MKLKFQYLGLDIEYTIKKNIMTKMKYAQYMPNGIKNTSHHDIVVSPATLSANKTINKIMNGRHPILIMNLSLFVLFSIFYIIM